MVGKTMRGNPSLEVNKDTDFPHWFYPFEDDLEILDAEEVRIWFKRCMEDFPHDAWQLIEEDDLITEGTMYEGWFVKWFSQFNKKDEK